MPKTSLLGAAILLPRPTNMSAAARATQQPPHSFETLVVGCPHYPRRHHYLGKSSGGDRIVIATPDSSAAGGHAERNVMEMTSQTYKNGRRSDGTNDAGQNRFKPIGRRTRRERQTPRRANERAGGSSMVGFRR
jgi:hypothetical protein